MFPRADESWPRRSRPGGLFLRPHMQIASNQAAITAILKHRRYWQDQHLEAQAGSDLERILLSHIFIAECDLILSVLESGSGGVVT
jgi:hypothetical protein